MQLFNKDHFDLALRRFRGEDYETIQTLRYLEPKDCPYISRDSGTITREFMIVKRKIIVEEFSRETIHFIYDQRARPNKGVIYLSV